MTLVEYSYYIFTRVSKNIAFFYVYNSNAQFSETSTPSPNRKCESRVDSE